LWRPEATVMLVGFQPVGTLGRLLLDGRKRVTIQGEEVRVRAAIEYLDIYSGHADGPSLTAWAKARSPVHGHVFLTHGEPSNLEALQKRLITSGFKAEKVEIAAMDASYSLKKQRAAPEQSAPRLDPTAASRLDWHNARADFLTQLNHHLRSAKSDADREALLERLHSALTASKA
jgi:metallo-beta-lactamase family protein